MHINKNTKSTKNLMSRHVNVESLMSRESTPSEFPLVKSAVRFLLKKNKREKIKSNSRSIFSPFSNQSSFSPKAGRRVTNGFEGINSSLS